MDEEKGVLSQWQEWNAQGFIPGPDESEKAFLERVAFCLSLEDHLVEIVGAQFPFEVNDLKSKEILENVLTMTQELYGIQPRWVPLFFSNYKLSLWHGGCAWIFQLNEETPTAAFLQLRACFRNSLNFLGIYQRKELIAHELAHVGRMLYQEPQFEEISRLSILLFALAALAEPYCTIVERKFFLYPSFSDSRFDRFCLFISRIQNGSYCLVV